MKNFIKNTMKTVTKNLGKIIPTFSEENWSKNNSYDNLTIVYDSTTNSLYLSKKDVPVNIEIINTEYWQLIITAAGYSKQEIDNKLAEKQNLLTFDSTPIEDSGNPVTSDGIKTYINTIISVLYEYKGSCTYAELPSSGNKIGDVWNVTDAHSGYPAGTNYAWDGTGWDALGGLVDFSNYYTKTEVDNKLSEKSSATNLENGAGFNSLVQKGSNGTAFGDNSVVEGKSVTNAVERGITDSSTDSDILTEWESSSPESDKFSLAKGEAAHVEGINGLALGNHSHVEGNGCVAANNSAHAEGTGSMALNKYAHAEGLETKALGQGSHTEGNETTANGYYTHAEGVSTEATPRSSHAEGYLSVASKDTYSENTLTPKVQPGTDSSWYNGCSHAEGNATIAQGLGAHSEGEQTFASNRAAHAEGAKTVAGAGTRPDDISDEVEGNFTHAEGQSTFAKGNSSHAEGRRTQALSKNSHAEGWGGTSEGVSSHVEGEDGKSNNTAEASHVEGYNCETGGNYTSNTKSDYNSTAKGEMAHAEGNSTIAVGNASHSEGKKTFASGINSHAEGNETTASGENSHAEGNLTKASGMRSHAEGFWTVASGNNSHAEGISARAEGDGSHAEGQSTVASGEYSHAEGFSTKALDSESHAEGYQTIANNISEHAEGIYNYSHKEINGNVDENKAGSTQHSIGIGSSISDRKNAFEVMQNGLIYIYGVNGYDGTNPNPASNGNSLQAALAALGVTIDSSLFF